MDIWRLNGIPIQGNIRIEFVMDIPSRGPLPYETSDLSRPGLVVKNENLAILSHTEKSEHAQGHQEACGGVWPSLIR